MTRRTGMLVLLAGCAASAVFGAGAAHAQPEPSPPVVPSLIDQLLTSTPALVVDPNDEGGPGRWRDDVGMICQNLTVHCR